MKKTIILAAAAALLAACGAKEQPEQKPGTPEAQAAQPAPQAPAKAGAYTPKDTYFKLPAAAGGEVDLASYAGKPVMLMFFTETCPYCRAAGPYLEKLYKKYSAKGLGVVGVCLQPNADAPKAFAKDLGITFPLAYKGRDLARTFKTQGVPYIFVLDSRHEVYDVWEGYDPSFNDSIEKTVERVLPKK